MIRKILQIVDKWGPAATSVVTLSLLIAVGWWYSERIAKLEGIVESQQNQLNICINQNTSQQTELLGLNKWIIAVYSKLDSTGWKVPPLPDSSDKKGRENVSKETPLQPSSGKNGRMR